tara:strand:+ start:610 stop:1194 length:585 start_codon:yes stop_codon:yes gene_type:complete
MISVFFVLFPACSGEDSYGSRQTADGLLRLDIPWAGIGQHDLERSLVDGNRWVLASGANDPFRPQTARDDTCDDRAYSPEYEGVEIRTGACGYITISQPIRHAIARGDLIHIIAWHSNLFSPDPTRERAKLSIRFGDSLLWAVDSPIPSNARSFDFRYESPRAIAKGAPVYINVSNHGTNSWNILGLRIQRTEN